MKVSGIIMSLSLWGLAAASAQITNLPSGSIVAWGENGVAAGLAPSGLSGVVRIDARHYCNLGLMGDGRLFGWKEGVTSEWNVPALTGVVDCAVGAWSGLALSQDGMLVAWGSNSYGATNIPTNLNDVVAIDAGSGTFYALQSNGRVSAWGDNTWNQTSHIPQDSDFIAIAAGSGFCLALKTNGTVVGWGRNDSYQLWPPAGLSNVIAIAAGDQHALALQHNGTVVVWGGGYGQGPAPSSLSNVVAIAAGGLHSMALRSDGTVVSWGYNGAGQTNVPAGLSNVVAIAAGQEHSVAVKSDTFAPVYSEVPACYVDGKLAKSRLVYTRSSAQVSLLATFPGLIYYSLDGSDPRLAFCLYEGPVTVAKSATVRAVAYTADFTRSFEMLPVQVTVLPSLTAQTAGGGTVAVDPPEGPYAPGSQATLTATPSPGWTFLQWLGDATGPNSTVVLQMDRGKTVQADFGTALNKTVVGAGSIVTEPVSPLLAYGRSIRLTAVPAEGNYFLFWGNAGAGQTNNPLSFKVTNANPTVTAVFAGLGISETAAVTVIPDGLGAVAATPSGNRLPLGSNVVLQAIPQPGQQFLGWGGAVTGLQNPLPLTVLSNTILGASFTKRPTLRVGTSLEGLVEDGFRFTLLGLNGGVHPLFGSSNLLDWQPVGTVTNAWGAVQFTDPAGTNQSKRFYRAESDE